MKSFNEIKIKDTLSVDYKVTSAGKNLAKNISFEKAEILPADAQDSAAGNVQLSAPLQAAAPVVEQPMAQPATAAIGSVVEATDTPESVSATAQQAQ